MRIVCRVCVPNAVLPTCTTYHISLPFFLLWLACSSIVYAGPDELRVVGSPVQEKGVIIAGSGIDHAPYAFVNSQDRAEGFSLDLLRAVAEVMDFDLEIRTQEWENLRTALEQGSIDVLATMAYSEARDSLVDFSVPYTVAYDGVFVRKEESPIESMSALQGKSIIAVRAGAAHDYLQRSGLADQAILTATTDEALRLLASGQGDAAIVPKLIGLLTVQELQLSNLEGTDLIIEAYERAYCFAVVEGNAELVGRLNHGLEIIRATGRYDEIYDKWFGTVDEKGLAMSTVLLYVLGGTAIPVAFLVVAFLWSMSLKRKVAQRTKDLRESEERYRVLVEKAPEAIVVLDPESLKFVDANANAERLVGLDREALLRSSPFDVSTSVQPNGLPVVESTKHYIKEALEGKAPVFEWQVLNAQGEVIPCEVRLAPIPFSGRMLLRGSVTDISDKKQAEAERESFIKELEARNAELERFAYTISHDLKNPLVTIKGFSGLLEQDVAEGNGEKLKRDVEHIQHAAETMQLLLADLLEFFRIGRTVNPLEEVALTPLTQEVVRRLGPLAEARGVKVEVAPDLPTIYGDRARLLDMIQGLIDNAIKFMGDQPDPQVVVGVRQDKHEQVCFVRDNGIGIKAKYHAKVFELFERLNADKEGTGIGLALVRRVVEEHGGHIWVESDGVGQGATLCFVLPEHRRMEQKT